jgi:hypothetical protein
MPVNKIGQRLLEINEVCVFIIEIPVEISVQGMDIAEAQDGNDKQKSQVDNFGRVLVVS